ncbi:uncharacterized protein [Pyxicephalus adspersus]|uniref:uncharacterized protein isoform X2 n=1 Tax=Pyxicephalus adspersus TaxID=30357 RepID=UPI003B5B9AE8
MIVKVLFLLCLQQTGWALRLSEHQGMMGENVDIPCSLRVKDPTIDRKSLSIIWFFQGKEILSVQNVLVKSKDPRMSYRARAEDGIADLSISNITITDGGIYKCLTSYKSEKEEKEIRLDVQAPPQITITNKVVVKNKESSLQSVISGFYPVDIDIKWLRDGEILGNDIMGKPQKESDATYSVRSSVKITPTEEDRERIFSCRVQHESLTAPLQEDFQLVYGDIPSVHIISQVFKLDVKQRLVCIVSGFYPESITVNWFLNDTLLENAKTERISSSAVESVYYFTPTKQDFNMELRCVVDHATLTSPHVERLLVKVADLTAQYKKHTVIASVMLVITTAAIIIILLFIKERKRRLPKVRRINRFPDGTFSLDVDHFYPEEITVSWKVIQPPSSTQPRTIKSKITMDPNQDGTFNATSTCESLRGEIEEDEEYVVQAVVEHRKLKHPKCTEWRGGYNKNKDFLLQPEVGIIKTPKLIVGKQIQLQCTMSRFYPDELSVDWFLKEKGKEELTNINNSGRYKIPSSSSRPQPNKTFTHTALLEFTPSPVDEGSEVICRVNHPSLEEPIERTTGPLQMLDFPWRPKIEYVSPLIVQEGQETNVTCKISNYFPENLTVTWLEKKGASLSECTHTKGYHIPDIKHERTANNTYQCSSSLSFIATSYTEDLEFICRVEHPSLGHPIQQSIGPPRINVPPQEPKGAKFTIHGSDQVLCSLSLMRFYPQNIKIMWRTKDYNSTNTLLSTKKILQTNDEKTFEAISECVIPWRYFETPVRVTWEHDSLKEAGHWDLTIRDFPWQPVIEETDRPTLLENTKTRLTYKISNYFPNDLSVTWHKKEKNGSLISLPTHRQDTSMALLQPDHTYSCTTSLLITPLLPEDQGSEFICRVRHPSLGGPMERSTGPLQVCGALPDPVIGEIIVPELIAGKRAALSCKVSNYIIGKHLCIWHVKVKSTGEVTLATYDGIKYPTIEKDDTSDVQNTFTTYLALVPVEQSDDGSVFIVRVYLPDTDRVIESRTGLIHVKAAEKTPAKTTGDMQQTSTKPRESTEETANKSLESPENTLQPKEEDLESPGQKQELKTPKEEDEKKDGKTPSSRAVLQEDNQNTTENSTQEEKDQCAESTKEHILADNGKSKSSEQEEQCEPSNETREETYKEQPSGPGNMEEKDNPDTDTAVNSSPSNLETDKGPMKLALKMEIEQKEDHESPEKNLQPKEEVSESAGQKRELKTPKEGDEETDGKTPTSRAVLQEENLNTTENNTIH